MSTEKLGAFIRELIISINSSSEPLYSLEYDYSDDENYIHYNDEILLINICTINKSYMNHADFEGSKCIFIFNSGEIYFENTKIKRFSTSEFEEEYFQLSTVYDERTLKYINLSTYVNDIKVPPDYSIIINTKECEKFYEKVKANNA